MAVRFNISAFPKFINAVDTSYVNGRGPMYRTYTDALIGYGFRSANYSPNNEESCRFSLDDKEFTIFALTWS